MYTVESKSLLAKLMATENITVEHRSTAKTAGFNLKTRVLTCPIWKDMDGDLYDLLMGHEISHALRTPLEGWHDSVIYAGGNKKASAKEQKAFKHFLNVVEDARIEKLVKRQFPGLRAPMFRGYRDLLARDFFGLSHVTDLDDLYLIDKLNLAAKVGVLLNVTFTAKEQPFYDEMQNLETFEDVLALSRKLYEYSKHEQQKPKEEKKKEKKTEQQRQQDEDGDGQAEQGDGEDAEGEEGSEEGEGDSASSSSEDSDEDSEGGEGEGDSDEEDDSENPTTSQSEDSGVGSEEDENFIPSAKTDEMFRWRERLLIDTGDVRSVYIKIPTPNLADVVTPVALVNVSLNTYYCTREEREAARKLLADFKAKNEEYVSLLAKEFEMKKAARSYKAARKAETGDIDITKLASYRTEDNIFKKLMVVQKGKSHGLVLILDRSASMVNHIEAATEQIMILALFCRKVNIPFVAYSFTSGSEETRILDFGMRAKNLKPFSENGGEFLAGAIAFREILNSTMRGAEFNHSMENQLLLARELAKDRCSYARNPSRPKEKNFKFPEHESMGSTPLNEAIVIMRDVVRKFKRQFHLDIVNTIIVHDGDSDRNYTIHQGKHPYTSASSIPEPDRFDTRYDRVTIRDVRERVDFVCPRSPSGLQTALLAWLQATAHCGVFGFYITGGHDDTREALKKMYVNKLGDSLKGSFASGSPEAFLLTQLQLRLATEKFVESFTAGYSRFYFIPGSTDLTADNGELTNTASRGKWTPNRLLAAFKKVSKKRVVSRVLVSRFIELIATR